MALVAELRFEVLALVTRNLREFARVPGLATEDWHSPEPGRYWPLPSRQR